MTQIQHNNFHYFHVAHNTPCLPKNLHNHCLRFLWRRLWYPGEIGNNSYAKFWDVSKVYYGQCERIPPGRRKTIWLFRKLAKVLSWSLPVNKSSCWSEWSSKAAALDCESRLLTTLSPKKRIANVRFMAQVALQWVDFINDWIGVICNPRAGTWWRITGLCAQVVPSQLFTPNLWGMYTVILETVFPLK